jgi:hypothetical protein
VRFVVEGVCAYRAVITSNHHMAKHFGDYYYPEFADTVKYLLKDIFICIIKE